jgi:type I restriction enzyme S subunit
MKSPWPTKKLGEICEERKEKNIKNLNLPVYAVSNIFGFVLSEEFFSKRVYSESLINYKLVYKHDFAYNPARVNVGSLGLFREDEPGLISPMYIVFYIKDKNTLDPHFLFYLLKTNFYQDKIKNLAASRGSIRQTLKLEDLLNLEIPLPPLSIQQKIVKILDTIQSAIEIQERIIEKTKELKKSLMAELFKYGAPSFRKGRKLKKTEIGEIPEDWEVVRLGEYFEFKNGINFKKEQKGKGVLVLDVLNMYTDSLYPNLNEIYRVEGSFSEEYYLKQGDILFVRSSLKQEGVGWCSVFPGFSEPVLFCGFLIRARPKTEKTNSNFFVYLFRTENFRNQIISQSGVVTITNLSQSILSNLLIPLPPLPEQREIAEILQTIDQKIEIEKKKKELYEELFRTMLNKIMSQEIDVEKIEI